MARRQQVWLRGSVAWGVCFFMAGCLFHNANDPDHPFAGVEKVSPSMDQLQPAPSPTNAPFDPSPPILSTYGARPLESVPRMMSSLDPPIERVRVDLTPGSTPEQEKKDPEIKDPARTPSAPDVPPPPRKEEARLLAVLLRARENHPHEVEAILNKNYSSDRDLLIDLLRLTADVDQGELAKMPAKEVERTLEQLSVLTSHLRQRAPLTLGKVCFCRKIENFGQYAPAPPEHQKIGFQAGCDGRPGERVQIYAEVRNFGSQLRNGQYETVLASSLEFYHGKQKDDRGKRLPPDVTMNLDPCIDRSQSPRQDYFLNFQFHVPRGLPPGLYTLWVTVKDVTPASPGQPNCERVARRSLDFKVCPPGTTPSARRNLLPP